MDSSDKTSSRKTTWCLFSLFHYLPSFKLTCEAAQIFHGKEKNVKYQVTPEGMIDFKSDIVPEKHHYLKNSSPNAPAEEFCFKGGICLERAFSSLLHTDLVICSWASTPEPAWWLICLPHETHRRFRWSKREKRSISHGWGKTRWVCARSYHPVWGLRTRSEKPNGIFSPPHWTKRMTKWLRESKGASWSITWILCYKLSQIYPSGKEYLVVWNKESKVDMA